MVEILWFACTFTYLCINTFIHEIVIFRDFFLFQTTKTYNMFMYNVYLKYGYIAQRRENLFVICAVFCIHNISVWYMFLAYIHLQSINNAEVI